MVFAGSIFDVGGIASSNKNGGSQCMVVGFWLNSGAFNDPCSLFQLPISSSIVCTCQVI